MILPKRSRTRLPYPLASQLRYLAVGVVYSVLGALVAPRFRRKVRLDELTTARILILKPCCLGDVVFATALVRELRHALPNAHVTFGVGKHSRPAIATHPAIDALLDTDPVGSGAYTPRDYLALVNQIRSQRFDACLVLERSALLALLPLFAGVPTRIGIDSGGRGFSLTVGVSAQPARPESALYLDLLRAIGGRPRSGEIEYVPSPEATRRVDALVRERLPSERRFAVLHCAGGTNPGMTLLRKRWPMASFHALARRIARAGVAVVLVGSADDRAVVADWESGIGDRGSGVRGARSEGNSAAGQGSGDVKFVGDLAGECRELAASPNTQYPSPIPFVDLIGQLSLDELAALARRAVVYVGNDSGPTHLAEAAGANVVMLFGPSDPIVYGPRNQRAVAVTAGLWCSPCFENGRIAPCANVICMQALSVERVWRDVSRFVNVEEGR